MEHISQMPHGSIQTVAKVSPTDGSAGELIHLPKGTVLTKQSDADSAQ